MADLPSSKVKINDIEVAQEAALSESFFSKVGSSINALIDDTNTNAANIATNNADIASAVSVNNTQTANIDSIFNGLKSLSVAASFATGSTGSLQTRFSHTFNFSGAAGTAYIISVSSGTFNLIETTSTGSTEGRILLNGTTVWSRPFIFGASNNSYNFASSTGVLGALFSTTIITAPTNSVLLEIQARGTSSLSGCNVIVSKVSL